MQNGKKYNYWKVCLIVFILITVFLLVKLTLKEKNNSSKTISSRERSQDITSRTTITDKWKTYTSDIISFRYPPEWSNEPKQEYYHHDTIIPFTNGFITLTLVPYDSYRFSEAQRNEGITLDSMTFVHPEQYKDIEIDHHRSRRLYDPKGQPGVTMPTYRLVIDVPEKSHFIEINVYNPYPSLGLETMVARWINPLVSTIRIIPTYPAPEIKYLQFQIPPSWKRYEHQYQGLKWQFMYPPICQVYEDDSGGPLSLSCNNNNIALEISRILGKQGWSSSFEEASIEEWYTNNMIDNLSAVDKFERTKLHFSAIDFNNGSIFRQVTYDDQNTFPFLNIKGSDYYVGIVQKNGIHFIDYRKLSQEDVYKIMQSMQISAINP